MPTRNQIFSRYLATNTGKFPIVPGRGGSANRKNTKYREITNKYKASYQNTMGKYDKANIVRAAIDELIAAGGEFYGFDGMDFVKIDPSDCKIYKRVAQFLREKICQQTHPPKKGMPTNTNAQPLHETTDPQPKLSLPDMNHNLAQPLLNNISSLPPLSEDLRPQTSFSEKTENIDINEDYVLTSYGFLPLGFSSLKNTPDWV